MYLAELFLNLTFQTMFAMLKTGNMERFMSDLEILGLLVACLCHDLDHRGTNNAFQTKTESPLAILYTTSTMEHHVRIFLKVISHNTI